MEANKMLEQTGGIKMWSWNDKYNINEMNNIIDGMVDFIIDIVDEQYNNGNYRKDELIDLFMSFGFHGEDVDEWYGWLEE